MRGVCAAGTIENRRCQPCAPGIAAVCAHSRAHCLRVCAAVKYLLCLDFKL